ncbi:hypothetical protein DFJ73DRAFT_786827 [Zopfochytrium polystomum]|nr:hypothetical protein DFJ73DRAFT_786827 [Zopfochytrium polystomum]
MSTAQHLDNPQAGADDSAEDEELKYHYILHSGEKQVDYNECSPMVFDFGFTGVITIPQIPKSLDDPARLWGLTYEKISNLMEPVFVFDL